MVRCRKQFVSVVATVVVVVGGLATAAGAGGMQRDATITPDPVPSGESVTVTPEEDACQEEEGELSWEVWDESEDEVASGVEDVDATGAWGPLVISTAGFEPGTYAFRAECETMEGFTFFYRESFTVEAAAAQPPAPQPPVPPTPPAQPVADDAITFTG